MAVSNFLKNLGRLKMVDLSQDDTPLKQCLTTVDLTLLGISSMVGVTLYVLTGVVAKETAGPSIVLSYIIACTAALLAGMCYAELGSIFTKTGSAYLFTYSIIGELPAFLVGWSILLEYILSSAVIARGWSGYLDSILNHQIQNFTIEVLMGGEPWTTPYFASVPDLVSGFIMVITTLVVTAGASISCKFNNVLLLVNLTVAGFITIGGFIFADGRNWSDKGFFPYGIDGTISGAAIIFIGFVGFDIITVSSEESIDSRKSVPRAILLSIAVVAVTYIAVAMSLTLAVPYYEIDITAVLATPFANHGLIWAKNIVDVGALCSMGACMVCSFFALPRMVYAMSIDGLLLKVFSSVNSKTQTPLVASLCFGVITSIISIFFDITTLSAVLSIGTLFAFTMVAACVMLLRYRTSDLTRQILNQVTSQDSDTDEDGTIDKARFLYTYNDDSQTVPGGELKPRFQFLTAMKNYQPGTVPCVCIATTMCLMFTVVFIVVVFLDNMKAGDWWAILLVIVLSVSAVLTFIPIALHEQVNTGSAFKVGISLFSLSHSLRCLPACMPSTEGDTILFQVLIYVLLVVDPGCQNGAQYCLNQRGHTAKRGPTQTVNTHGDSK